MLVTFRVALRRGRGTGQAPLLPDASEDAVAGPTFAAETLDYERGIAEAAQA